MSNDNVIDLKSYKDSVPVANDAAEPPTPNKQDLVIDISIALAHDMIDKLRDAGYTFESKPEIAYDLVMLTEAIKSIVYTAEGDYYPLHKIAESVFDEDDIEGFIEEFLE